MLSHLTKEELPVHEMEGWSARCFGMLYTQHVDRLRVCLQSLLGCKLSSSGRRDLGAAALRFCGAPRSPARGPARPHMYPQCALPAVKVYLPKCAKPKGKLRCRALM